jgi:general stress protein YciG
MGTKAKAKTKAGKRGRTTKDLTARQAVQVKGGKSVPGDFSFVHKVDKASPVLLT